MQTFAADAGLRTPSPHGVRISLPQASGTSTGFRTPSPQGEAHRDASSVLTSIDGQPYSYPSQVFVQNTFVQCPTLRTTSFDEFFQERQIRSCPASCMKSELAPNAEAVPPSSLTTADSSRVSSAASLGEFSARSYDDQFASPAGPQFAAPGGGYVTMGIVERSRLHAGVAMESGMPVSRQNGSIDPQPHFQQQVGHVSPDQFTFTPDSCTPTHMSAGPAPYPACRQPNHILDYCHQVPPLQQDVDHHHGQQMYTSPIYQADMQFVDDGGVPGQFDGQMYMGRNPTAAPAHHSGHMFTQSAFSEYRVPSSLSGHKQPREYAGGFQQFAYEAHSAEDQWQPGGQVQQSSASCSQPGPMNQAMMQHHQQPRIMDATEGPPGRMVLQLSAAISKQEQHQLEQHDMQQWQQQKHPDATNFLPPPPLEPPRLESIARAPGNDMPSVGSIGHEAGTCKPCAFMFTKGCGNGFDCQFCHICQPGEKKKRRKDKTETRRTMRQMVSGGLSGWWGGVRGGTQSNQTDLHAT